MSAVSEREILEVLREISSKLDAVVARLEALEERVIGAGEPKPRDVEAYLEAEREREGGRLIPFERK